MSPSLVAQTAGSAVCGFSMVAAYGRGPQTRRSALPCSTAESREQSQNVYENKGQVQNVAEPGSAGCRFCGLRLFHGC